VKIFSGFVEKIETYVKNEVELVKLDVEERISKILIRLFIVISLIFLIGLVFILTSIGLSLWINSLLSNSYVGFFITALMFALLSVLVYANRKHPFFQSKISTLLHQINSNAK
jgi:Putative Actinobacterial Holin-X, holin superfamily III